MALSKYNTTLEEDKYILQKEENLGENETNCIKLRMGEKEVLKEVIILAESCLKLFDRSLKVS